MEQAVICSCGVVLKEPRESPVSRIYKHTRYFWKRGAMEGGAVGRAPPLHVHSSSAGYLEHAKVQ